MFSSTGKRSIYAAAVLATALALVGSTVASAGEAATIEDLERRVRELEQMLADVKATSGEAADPRFTELERQIDVLTREIEKLSLGEAAPEAEESRHGLGPAASKVYATRRGVSLGGYGELLYRNFDATNESGTPAGESDTIDLLRFVLYTGYKFNDTMLFNSEIEFEHATTGEGDEERGEVSVEFAYLDFLLREPLNVRAGLVLVPVGFLNELHEPPVFLGSARPSVERFLLPTTWREVGAGVFGDVGTLTYRAYLTSSLASVAGTSSGAEGFTAEGIRDGRASGSSAAADDFALSGRLDWKPVPGLLLGASLFSGDTSQGQSTPTGEAIDGRITLWDAHGEYRWRGLQARALFVQTAIDDTARINEAQGFSGAESVGERQYGYYLELGFDVLAARETHGAALIPFVRRERYDTQDRVPAGYAADPAHDVTVSTLGLVWKPIPHIAVKADYDRVENEARSGVDRFQLALGFLF